MLKKLTFFSFLLLFALELTSCDTPFISPPRPAYLSTGEATAGGAMAAGLLTAGTVVPVTAGAAIISGGISSLFHSTHHLLVTLENEGVQIIQYGDTLRIIMPSDALFDFNDANIYIFAPPILNNVILFLRLYGNVPITILAYTDNVLSPHASFSLTREQAKAIAGYLWSHGIAFDKVNPIGMGSSDPIATNGNSRGSAYNRRVELILPVLPAH